MPSVLFWQLAAIGAVMSILGNFLGSGLAIQNGSKIVRPTVILVLILLAGKIVYSLLGGG